MPTTTPARPVPPPVSIHTVTLESAGKRTKWTLVTRFRSLAERDGAVRMGFTSVLAEGTEKFNDLVKGL